MNTIRAFIVIAVLFILPSSLCAQSTCINLDFENSPAGAVTTSNQVSGWICSGTLSAPSTTGGLNNCNLLACCPNNPVSSMLISAAGGYTDTKIGVGYPIYSVFGDSATNSNAAIVNPQITFPMKGKNFFRLASSNSSPTRTERLTKIFAVTPTNYMLDIAFISVLSRGHACCESAMFQVNLNNSNCPNIYTNGSPPGSCAVSKGVTYLRTVTGQIEGPSSNFSEVFNRWTIRSIDLSNYMGQTVTVNFTAGGCTTNGHPGYAYLDTQCGTASIKANQNNFPLSIGITSVSSCQNTATLTAPPYFENYKWMNSQGITATTAVLSTSVPATFTLTLSNTFSCNPTSYTVVVMPPPTLSISTNQEWSCVGTPVVLSANGVSNYTWSNGSNLNNIKVNPTVATTYSLIGKDIFACTLTQTITQQVTDCLDLGDALSLNENIKLYPNPNQKEFMLFVPAIPNAVFVLENSGGQKVYQSALAEGENHIKTGGLAVGIYYYKILSVGKEVKRGKLKLE